jgi:hypothetical protein
MGKKHADSDRHQRVLARLRDYAADQNLENLVRAGADRMELLKRLCVLYQPPTELQRLSKREAQSLAQRIRQNADLIESLNSRPDNNPLLEAIHVRREIPLPSGFEKQCWQISFSYREILCWPEAMREYASRVEVLPRYVQGRWQPIQTAAIAQLVWYVKASTKKDHDEDVSPLIGAVLRDGNYSADALKLWRSRHRTEIGELGPLSILPFLPRRPRSR